MSKTRWVYTAKFIKNTDESLLILRGFFDILLMGMCVVCIAYINVRILDERICTSMLTRDVTITNSIGLHARPATFFIQKANSYKSSIWVEKDDRRVNAKSLLGVLSLGIAKGMTVTLIADGQDEDNALDGLSDLIDTGFAD